MGSYLVWLLVFISINICTSKQSALPRRAPHVGRNIVRSFEAPLKVQEKRILNSSPYENLQIRKFGAIGDVSLYGLYRKKKPKPKKASALELLTKILLAEKKKSFAFDDRKLKPKLLKQKRFDKNGQNGVLHLSRPSNDGYRQFNTLMNKAVEFGMDSGKNDYALRHAKSPAFTNEEVDQLRQVVSGLQNKALRAQQIREKKVLPSPKKVYAFSDLVA